MNRHDRRRRAAITRQNAFYKDYVSRLPEVGPEVVGKPGVFHAVHFHDERCPIYDGRVCTCDPEVRFFAEPERA